MKAHNEIVKQKFEVTKYRVYFSRTLLLDNQVGAAPPCSSGREWIH